MTENYKKWEITLDLMIIIGKYFEENKEFINVIKLNKKFKDLLECYKYNPISDYKLFPNIQTQHFYKEGIVHKSSCIKLFAIAEILL